MQNDIIYKVQFPSVLMSHFYYWPKGRPRWPKGRSWWPKGWPWWRKERPWWLNGRSWWPKVRPWNKGKTLVTGGMEGAQRTRQPCLRLIRQMNGGGDNVRWSQHLPWPLTNHKVINCIGILASDSNIHAWPTLCCLLLSWKTRELGLCTEERSSWCHKHCLGTVNPKKIGAKPLAAYRA